MYGGSQLGFAAGGRLFGGSVAGAGVRVGVLSLPIEVDLIVVRLLLSSAAGFAARDGANGPSAAANSAMLQRRALPAKSELRLRGHALR